MPSAARCSRVPSVAIQLDAERQQVAREVGMPSRLATESRARTWRFLLRAVRRRVRGRDRDGDVPGSLRGWRVAAEYSVAAMAYSDRPHRRPRRRRPGASETRRVKLWPWEYLFQPFDRRSSRTCSTADLVASLVAADRDGDLLQRPDPPAAPPPDLPADVRVAPVDGRHHVRPDARRTAIFRFDFLIVLATLVTGCGRWSGSGSSASRRTSRAYERQLAKQRYYSRAAVHRTRRRRSATKPADGAAAAEPARRPCRSRSAGSGSATAGPTARRARPASRARSSRAAPAGVIAELAFSRGARITPHTNPNSTWLHRDRGRRLGRRRRRADAGPGRRGGRLAAGRAPRRLDRRRAHARDRRRAPGPTRAAGLGRDRGHRARGRAGRTGPRRRPRRQRARAGSRRARVQRTRRRPDNGRGRAGF